MMKPRNLFTTLATLVTSVALLIGGRVYAQTVVQDNFTGAYSNYNWVPFNGACLTAGNGTGTIPACVGAVDTKYYYGEVLVGGNTGLLPDDPTTGGALRFTNGYPTGLREHGAIVSNFTFPSNQGLQVTFTSVTYGGNSCCNAPGNNDGADGISFFLMDGSSAYQPDIGAFGGSLAFTCTNDPGNLSSDTHPDGTVRGYDGLGGGYLGLGIDEFGNFLNGANTPYQGFTGANGDNTASGIGYKSGTIGLRGAGSIAWKYLALNYPSKYPSTLTQQQRYDAVQNTCISGKIWDYSKSTPTLESGTVTTTTVLDYAAIPNAYKTLPSTFKIANESASTRSQATPITYLLQITPGGLLSLSYKYNGGAYQSVIAGQDITASNGPIPTTFRFGFAGSTGGASNIHEVLCFQAAPASQTGSSAGVNQQQAAKVQTGSQVYFAYYNPTNYAGSLVSSNLVDDGAGNLSVSATPNWDASCVLTGVPSGQKCVTTGVAGLISPEAPASRTILSWNPTASKGIPFEWASLTSTQQSTLDQGDGSNTANRLQFLRGDRSNEVNASGVGLYRARGSVLGDIVDSSPAWVGPPSGPYGNVWKDNLYASASLPENAGPTYPQFINSAGSRTNVIYVGANDGLLHGFRTGAYSGTTYNTASTNDGYELLAYMPGSVVNTIHNSTTPTLDFSNKQYGHNYYVDAPPASGDLYYGGAWHTWLVGGLGPGGAAIYALDITNPSNFGETGSAPSSTVVGDWSAATITCINAGSCGSSLGNTYGTPTIRRFHNGAWGVVFGNGLGSTKGDAGIFVMFVDPSSATQKIYYLGTGVAASNGIVNATPADLDGDHIVDYVYAGDVLGNVWRFDVTNIDPTQWTIGSTPLFTTPNQPITTKVVVGSVPASQGPSRVLIEFGTGQQIPFTNTTATSYASGSQSLYGIWDWNLVNWNSKMSIQFASLAAPQSISATGAGANLQVQTIASVAAGYRTVSNNTVCWQGSTTCGPLSASNTQMGFSLALPGASEQIIYSPVLLDGAFIVNTTIPAVNSPLTCATSTATGYTMAIMPANGGSFTNSFFQNASHTFSLVNGQPIDGVALNGTGSVSVMTYNGKTYLVTQTSNGAPVPVQINPPTNVSSDRLTWVQRR